LFLGEGAEGFQSGLDLVGPRETAVHAQAIFVAVLDGEERAGSGADVVFEGIAVEAKGIDAGGKFAPEDESAAGATQARSFGEMAEDGLGEKMKLVLIGAAGGAEVVASAGMELKSA
jgi:hypothetical protein